MVALRAIVLVALTAVCTGCPAVYPEIGTALHKAPPDRPLEPAPPESLKWMKIVSAKIPPRARDGRTWDQAFGSPPDPYAKVFVNGVELFRTPAQADTLEPTWPDGPRGNFQVSRQDKLRVEIWDSNPLNDAPIGTREIGRLTEEQVSTKEIRVELEGGSEMLIAFQPAHAMLGVGLWFELRTDSCFITRMLKDSPAERSGVQKGDEVVEIGGRAVKSMSSDEVRSAFGSIPVAGLAVVLKHPDASVMSVTLKEGPIYPPYSQFGAVD
jgi:hypothetical protein